MKALKNLAGVTAALIASVTLSAQQNLMLYTMSGVPQSMYVNPASAPISRVNIGLPALSSIYFRHENTIYNPHHLFEQGRRSTAFRTQHFVDQVRNYNFLGADAAIDLFSLGLRLGEKNYFSIAVRERLTTRFVMPGDLIRFPFTGNARFDELDNGTLDFSGLRMQLNHYREIGFGWQREIDEQWSIGARLKLLYGYENIDTKTSNITWQTDETTYDWIINGEMDVYTSGIWPLTDTIDDNSDIENGDVMGYLLRRKNRGLGMDLGANFRMSDRLQFSASITDLGYIRWNTYNRNFTSEEGEFVFSGLELNEQILAADSSFSDTLDVVLNDLLDRFENSFDIKEEEGRYIAALLARIQLGANYRLYQTDHTSGTAGILIQSEFFKGHLRPTFTASYQQTVGRWLTAKVAYSVIDRNWRNLGFGLRLNGGPIQFYVATDNLLAGVLNRMTFPDNDPRTEDDSFIYPAYARTMQVHAGINLTFGRKPNDRDGDGVKDKKDVCPDTPGLPAFNGCPDSDSDGVQDAMDACPDTPGPIDLLGCPDDDGDGIINKEDECPDTPGLPAFAGCPDTDEDGIEDRQDECPDKAGTAKFGGCPDSDNDGLRDIDDNCPYEDGPIENQGCPWVDTDGDGVLDKDDACVEIAGPEENGGCPYLDQDGDSVLDKDDACPLTPGDPANFGCPVIEEKEKEIINTAFEDLEFVSGKAVIMEASKASLIELSELLIERDEWKLQIAGHTDNVGRDDANMELSKQRAQAVADFIESRGVNRDRLIVQWFGETQPVADNDSEEGRQRNRRVEMDIVFD